MPTDPVVDPKSSRARILDLEAEVKRLQDALDSDETYDDAIKERDDLRKRVEELEAGVIAEVDALFSEAEKKMIALSADRDHWFNVATQLREQLNGRALTIPTKAAGDPRLRGFK